MSLLSAETVGLDRSDAVLHAHPLPDGAAPGGVLHHLHPGAAGQHPHPRGRGQAEPGKTQPSTPIASQQLALMCGPKQGTF